MGQILFHLAFPVSDLEATKRFYVDGLGCALGRESSSAVTLELKGHQLVAHVIEDCTRKHERHLIGRSLRSHPCDLSSFLLLLSRY